MKNKRLLKFLKKDGRCLFSIGRYLIPTYYKTRKWCTISLKANRNKALLGNNILSFSELDLLNSCEECKDILQGYFKYAYNIDVIVTPLNP